MYLPPPLTVSGGKLAIEKIPITSLAKRFKTPMYIYSETRIRENFRRLRDAFKKNYEPVEAIYAVKGNNNPAIAKILVSEGCGIDASAPAEIWLARRLGVQPSKILYTGNYCTDEELAYGAKYCTRINLDDIADLLWGQDEFVSLQALNKFMQRLRIKLTQLGLPPTKLKTIRKRGYLLGI